MDAAPPTPAGPTRPVLRLRVPGSRRHLHFFRKMVVKPETFIEAGSLVDVIDRNNQPVGCGFYNPRSEIALRMLGPAEDGLLERRLREAVAFRETLGIDANAWRVCHAEGDGLPGLIIDRYADLHVVQLFSLGMLKQLDVIRKFFPRTHVTADERTQELEGFRLPAEKPPEGLVIREYGVEYRVDFARGHKTGFFCDQRENRREVAKLSRDKEVLDLCCYTGGFAVAAAKAGAKRVIGVDMDEEALETARRNAKLNRVKVEFYHQDIFNYLKQTKEKFDVVILDPPKMTNERDDLAKAKRGYFDMNRFAARVVKPGGILVSCSCTGLLQAEDFYQLVQNATMEREIRTFRIAGAGPDHPISSMYPEGRYLKVIYSVVI
jgi:23S rRNA (cytosine1962-C5)-methyltransferase